MKKNKNNGVFLGTPVSGAKTPREMKEKKFKGEKKGKKKNNGKKKYARIGSFRKKENAKSLATDLKKAGRKTKILTRKVRTRGGGPKIETSYSVYQRE